MVHRDYLRVLDGMVVSIGSVCVVGGQKMAEGVDGLSRGSSGGPQKVCRVEGLRGLYVKSSKEIGMWGSKG